MIIMNRIQQRTFRVPHCVLATWEGGGVTSSSHKEEESVVQIVSRVPRTSLTAVGDTGSSRPLVLIPCIMHQPQLPTRHPCPPGLGRTHLQEGSAQPTAGVCQVHVSGGLPPGRPSHGAGLVRTQHGAVLGDTAPHPDST